MADKKKEKIPDGFRPGSRIITGSNEIFRIRKIMWP